MAKTFPFYLAKNPSSQKPLSRFFTLTKGVIFAVAMVAPLLLANLVQMLTLIVRLFSPKAFRWLNWLMADLYWGYLVLIMERLNGVQPVFTGDELPKNENAMIICNHQNIADIPALMSLAARHGRLGDMKWFVKDIIKYIPGPGWGMLFLDCIFLKRNWLSDRARIEATFHNIVQHRVSIWLISFLEGTRITPEKLARSHKFAERRQLPKTDYVMVPRTKGFVASLQGLEGHLDAVYNVTIAYPNGIPSMWQLILGDVQRFAVDVIRTPVSALPKDGKELEQWVYDVYVEKDRKLKAFFETGAFPSKILDPKNGAANSN